MKKYLFVFFLLTCSTIFGQFTHPDSIEKYSLVDFWEKVLTPNNGDVVIKNAVVSTANFQEQQHVTEFLSQKREINHAIHLENIYFQGFQSYSGKGERIQKSNFVNLDSTTFNKPLFWDFKGISSFGLYDCIFNDDASFKFEQDLQIDVFVWRSKFNKSFKFIGNRFSPISLSDNTFELQHAWNLIKNFDKISIENCHFTPATNSKEVKEIKFVGSSEYLQFENSTFGIPITFGTQYRINDNIQMNNCSFSHISFENVTIPENLHKTYVKWTDLSKSLGINKDGIMLYDAYGDQAPKSRQWFGFDSDSAVANTYRYDKLKSIAAQFNAIYRAQGDVESSNLCYRDIKALEVKRWKYLYKQNPGFENLFRWRLNEIISVYSDYGTNPAKAVIKSFWVVLIFSFFYMFFPSEWDVVSKASIVGNLRLAINKHEIGILKHLLTALFLLIVSFANSFTLSMNSFITLGFGQIPAKGLARYITIFEGIVGWFLLTIFSVSLISQVLN